ncbi:hypothetical protein GGU11DRAFT_694398, partial [Lentinula aff. detonsa]
SLDKLKEVIIGHGGRIVDLDEPKLTHVVINKRDTSHWMKRNLNVCVCFLLCFLFLNKMGHRPTHQCLIVSDYVQVCVDEATLFNEEGE